MNMGLLVLLNHPFQCHKKQRLPGVALPPSSSQATFQDCLNRQKESRLDKRINLTLDFYWEKSKDKKWISRMNTLVKDIYQFSTAHYRLNRCKSYAQNGFVDDTMVLTKQLALHHHSGFRLKIGHITNRYAVGMSLPQSDG